MHRLAIVALLILSGVVPAAAKKKPTQKTNHPNKVQTEAATRLQVFLDRANFSPGKIDGRYNDVTLKALALYRESRGEQPQAPPSKSKAKPNLAPNVNGLDLGSGDADDGAAVGEDEEVEGARALGGLGGTALGVGGGGRLRVYGYVQP